MKGILDWRRDRYLARLCMFLIAAALIAGMVGCGPIQYNLAVSSTEGGEVTAPGEGTFAYNEGSLVILVAEADDGYQFVNWTGNVSAIASVYAATTTITINGHYSITANFAVAIEIWDWYDLDAIKDDLSGHYALMNDLDSAAPGYEELAGPNANREPPWEPGKGWEPIGNRYESFTGCFDGRQYEIRDLCINRTDADEDPVGLFGSVDEGGRIENVAIVNANVTGFTCVGGLVGLSGRDSYDSTVSNCYASGNIGGRALVGGLVGANLGTVADCYSSSSVIGRVYVGGLVGGTSISYGTVIDSYATGSVTGLSVVGGLVGRNDGTVSNCHATGNISGDDYIGGLVGQCLGGDETSVRDSHSTGNVNGDKHIGGLVGQSTCIVSNSYSIGRVTGDFIVGGLVGDSGNMVSSSYSTGTVTGNWVVGGLVAENAGTVSNSYSSSDVIGETSDVAGLVGHNAGSVENSYSKGSVTGNMYVGGVVGNNWGNVSYCYSTGTVTGNEEVGGLVGRNLVGENIEGTVTNSFWDTETSGQATSAGGTGKSTGEMQDITTFTGAGWNIIAVADSGTRNTGYIWNIVDGETYPSLSWQA
jgi:hypothetical protein